MEQRRVHSKPQNKDALMDTDGHGRRVNRNLFTSEPAALVENPPNHQSKEQNQTKASSKKSVPGIVQGDPKPQRKNFLIRDYQEEEQSISCSSSTITSSTSKDQQHPVLKRKPVIATPPISPYQKSSVPPHKLLKATEKKDERQQFLDGGFIELTQLNANLVTRKVTETHVKFSLVQILALEKTNTNHYFFLDEKKKKFVTIDIYFQGIVHFKPKNCWKFVSIQEVFSETETGIARLCSKCGHLWPKFKTLICPACTKIQNGETANILQPNGVFLNFLQHLDKQKARVAVTRTVIEETTATDLETANQKKKETPQSPSEETRIPIYISSEDEKSKEKGTPSDEEIDQPSKDEEQNLAATPDLPLAEEEKSLTQVVQLHISEIQQLEEKLKISEGYVAQLLEDLDNGKTEIHKLNESLNQQLEKSIRELETIKNQLGTSAVVCSMCVVALGSRSVF